MSKDFTATPETMIKSGHVYCTECAYLLPKSLLSYENHCKLFGFTVITFRAGSCMTGCTRGKRK